MVLMWVVFLLLVASHVTVSRSLAMGEECEVIDKSVIAKELIKGAASFKIMKQITDGRTCTCEEITYHGYRVWIEHVGQWGPQAYPYQRPYFNSKKTTVYDEQIPKVIVTYFDNDGNCIVKYDVTSLYLCSDGVFDYAKSNLDPSARLLVSKACIAKDRIEFFDAEGTLIVCVPYVKKVKITTKDQLVMFYPYVDMCMLVKIDDDSGCTLF